MSDQRMSRADGTGDAARLLNAAVRERFAVALADLFLPERDRLTEWHRTTMAGLLVRLIRSIEDELRASLAERFTERSHPQLNAALVAEHVELALPILEHSPALREPLLVALLLLRAEEHRLQRVLHSSGSVVLELLRDKDPAVAEAAMALLVAQSRRLDRFQEPVLASAELPAELEHRLVWTVGAALRSYMVERQAIAPDEADAALIEAARRRLAAYDEGDSLEARSLQLVARLDELGRLDASFVVRALAEAGLPLFLASLAQRSKLGIDSVWEIVCDPRGHGAPLLLRAAGVGRQSAGEILVALGATTAPADEESLARQLDLFESLSEEAAWAALRLWQADPAYRQAIDQLPSSQVAASAR
jgi:uncharacterized protein (DUF2336 family)